MMKTIIEAVCMTIREEMLADLKLFLIDEDAGAYGDESVRRDGGEFGHIKDAPIYEATIVGIRMRREVISETPFSNIFGLAMDQICNQAAEMNDMFRREGKAVPCGQESDRSLSERRCPVAWFAHVPGLKGDHAVQP